MRQIYPRAGPELDTFPVVTGGPLPAAIADIAALYGKAPSTADQRPFLRANMVASADGAAEIGGRSGPLGGPADRTVFTVLRSLADVILVGAGTARAERYRPVQPGEIWAGLRPGRPAVPPIAVISGSLDLAGSRLLDRPAAAETIIITSAAAPAERAAELGDRARLVVAGETRIDLAAGLAALGQLGYRHILTEGGPRLLGQLAAAGLVDELCLTVSPVLAAGSASRIIAAGTPAMLTPLALTHVLADQAGYLLTRYVRTPG